MRKSQFFSIPTYTQKGRKEEKKGGREERRKGGREEGTDTFLSHVVGAHVCPSTEMHIVRDTEVQNKLS